MFKDIVDCLDFHLGHIKYDTAFIKQLFNFRLSWSQKGPEYIEFLGSNLLGVHPIRFSNGDEELYFTDVLKIDVTKVKKDLHKLKGINTKFNVASNPFYLITTYMLHKFTIANLSKEKKEEGIREVYYIFAYKVTGSLLYRYFPFEVDESIAKVVYERLSKKYLIKKLGSWQKVYEHRALDLLPGGLHYDRLRKFNTEAATRVVIDTQGRIRETIKNIYIILMDVVEEKEKLSLSSNIQSGDDGESYGDVVNQHTNQIAYLNSIITSELDFIDEDIIYLLGNISKNLDIRAFSTTLKYLSKIMNNPKNKKIDIVTLTIEKNIEYLNSKNIGNDYSDRLIDVMKYVKGYWSSSSVKDKDIIRVKNYLYAVTKKATGKSTKWVIVTIVVNIIVYLFIRSITKK